MFKCTDSKLFISYIIVSLFSLWDIQCDKICFIEEKYQNLPSVVAIAGKWIRNHVPNGHMANRKGEMNGII